jgi:hypothetical protein
LPNARQLWKYGRSFNPSIESKAQWGTSTSGHDLGLQHWSAATQAFLDQHRKLRSQAAANNWTVPDDILAMSILSGLPPSWSPWIEATTSHYHLLNKPLIVPQRCMSPGREIEPHATVC